MAKREKTPSTSGPTKKRRIPRNTAKPSPRKEIRIPAKLTTWIGRREKPVSRSKFSRSRRNGVYLERPELRGEWPTGISATDPAKKLARTGIKLDISWH